MNKTKKLFILFITAFSISMTANSGYAILSVMKNVFVEKHKWFNEEEMSDYIALAQSAPGPIAVNLSMIIGYQALGIIGSLITVLGCILPPLIIMSVVTYFYHNIIDNTYVRFFMQGMQAGVVAMILDVLLSLFKNLNKKDIITYIILILSFIYIRFTKYSILYLVIFCILIAIAKSILIKKKVENN